MYLQLSAAIAFIAVPVAVACGGEIAPGESTSTTKKPTPTPTNPTATTTSLPTPTPQPTAACDAKGLSELDGSACEVSFQQTIFPKYISAAGTWQCSNSNCHGLNGSLGTSENFPAIDNTNALTAYAELAQYDGLQGEPYINTCSTNPADSAIDCNVKGSCAPIMPQSGAGVSAPAATPSEISDLETWLKCGAPFN